MNRPAFKPILNTELPHGFRSIRFERARDPHHPEGDSGTAYILIAPLDSESRIDGELAKKHKDACRVIRRRPGGEDSLGHLVHGPGGSWRFRYDIAGSMPDETGAHFDDERFEPGEYVSVHEHDGPKVYRIVSVLPL
ncbi:hypothetical protein [Bradyrhizobium sp.]|jgi:hypothetical protein|uniref:hypothetical protein n=1 Tax=Bradyrhizobium sp. TaxID=376 RepID=UPI003C4672B5